MKNPLEKPGKIALSVLSALIMTVQLFFVSLPNEMEKDFERISDPIGIVLALLFLLFIISLWVFRYPRWLSITIFLCLIIFDYSVGISVSLLLR